ncbi:MAG: ubiquinol-cytochrome c reductase iron-sulfur subunit [Chloroflexota bacterium]
MNLFSRRDFLKMAGQGLLVASGFFGLGIFTRFLGYQAEPTPPTEFDLGLASDYPVGSRTNLPDIPAVLVRSETGFSALSLVCTHLGCTLEQEDNIFSCPCHGSHFDEHGMVLRGPAKKGLVMLHVEQNDQGHVILYSAS